MKPELRQQIFDDFPRLFRAPAGDEFSIVRDWGFQCRDGWFALIYQVCGQIEAAAEAAGVDKESAEWPRAIQVKEKFGGLSFYLTRPDAAEEAIRAAVNTAAKASTTICEWCGAPGVLHQGDYWHTACEAHRVIK
jgi:hypothetical protein